MQGGKVVQSRRRAEARQIVRRTDRDREFMPQMGQPPIGPVAKAEADVDIADPVLKPVRPDKGRQVDVDVGMAGQKPVQTRCDHQRRA